MSSILETDIVDFMLIIWMILLCMLCVGVSLKFQWIYKVNQFSLFVCSDLNNIAILLLCIFESLPNISYVKLFLVSLFVSMF